MAKVQISVLGPVRLHIDGRDISLGPQEAALLAALVLAKGKLVTSRRLVALLWGDDELEDEAALQRRATTLRSHVAHLRKRLAPPIRSTNAASSGRSDPDGADAGPTSASVQGRGAGDGRGYLLELGPDDEVDVDRFEQWIFEARVDARERRRPRAVRRLDDALALWQDQPYLGLERYEFIAAEADRLRVLHIEAVELQIESKLMLGLHHEVYPELKDLVRRHPDRVNLYCHLMLAAFRQGSRDEALAVYEDGKAALRELGVDRAPLEQLRTKVLKGATDLGWAPLVPTPRGPLQLPLDVRGFVGRAAEIRWITDQIEDRTGGTAPLVLAFYGAPGIGKSALVNHVANRLQNGFDVVLTARLDRYGPSPYSSLHELSTFLRLLLNEDAAPPTDLRAASALFGSLLASRRALVVIDDAARSSDVEPLIPPGAQHVVLITSRAELGDLDGAEPRRLDVLIAEDAIALLATFVPRRRLDQESDAVAFLLEYCGGMPLALRIVGALLRSRPDWEVTAFCDWLIDDPLRRLQVGERDVATPIRRSYQTLTSSQARLFRLMGALSLHDVSLEVAVAVTGEPEAEVLADLGRLVEAQLVDEVGVGRYQMHHVVLLFARATAADADEPVDPRIDAVLSHYLDVVVPADTRLFDDQSPGAPDDHFPTPADAAAWFDQESRNLIALAQRSDLRARETGATFLVQLNWRLRRFFDLRSRWEDWSMTANAVLDAAQLLSSAREQGYAHRDLGIVAARRGQFDEATDSFGRAGDLLAAADDRFGEAAVVNNLALTQLLRGRPEEAIPALERAQRLFHDMDEPNREKTVTMNLGEAYRRVGRLASAVAEFERALTAARRLGDRVDEGKTLHNLGEAHRELGDRSEAKRQYAASMEVFDETGDEHTRALTLAGLALISESEDDVAEAVSLLEQALKILERLESTDAEDVRGHLDRLRTV